MAAAVCPLTGIASRAGLAQLFQGIDPGFCRLFAGGTNVRWLLLHKHIQRDVAYAAGFSDDMPFDRLHRIGLRSPTDCKNVGKTVLRNWIAASCSFLVTPVPLNSAIAYSTCASVLSASEAAASRRAASTGSFGTPRPSLCKVASAYWASGFPTWAALRKSCAARAKSCGNN